jgi:hypothetical protein
MKPFSGRKFAKRIVWLIAVFAGLCGGWLAAGVMNDHRVDIPRILAPTTQPANTAR